MDSRIILKAVARGKPTVCRGRKAAVPDALWRVSGTPPGSASGACIQRGSSGTWESHRSPCYISGLGDRATPGPGGVGELRPQPEPDGDTTNPPQQARYRGASDKCSASRGAAWQSSRNVVPVKVGKCSPSDPLEGRRRRAARGAARTDGRYLEITNRHSKTSAPCGASRPRFPAGVYHPGSPD